MNDREAGERLKSLSVAIVGLGLMGGSLAMALRGVAGALVGFDKDAGNRELALKLGVVDAVAARLEEGTAGADLVILAVPVESIVAILRELPSLRPDGCMVLDLGSTKREIGKTMDGLPSQFSAIGGHPMCGRERSGITAATNDLFRGQTFVLCRTARTTRAVEETAHELVTAIGASPLFLAPGEHDELVAASSHLPYVVSSVLMGQAWAQAARDERLWQVSASGLRDTTRLAGSNPQMMLEIMLTNRTPLLAQIEAYSRELAAVADALRSFDRETLMGLLELSAQRREAYMRTKFGDGESDA